MADINTNLTPGDPLPTSVKVWNPILEAARKAAQGDAGYPNLTPGSGFEIEVRVKNTEATTCPRFAPIGIGNDAIFVEPPALGWIETPVLKGIFPVDGGQIAIALEPIVQNGIGRAKLMGLVPATIDVSDAGHTLAKAVDGEFKFESATEGYPILWKQTGTGTKFGYVLIGSGTQAAGEKDSLFKAPSGGIPACSGAIPGIASCEYLPRATASGTGYAAGDYVRSGQFYNIVNWTFDVVAASGDRRLLASGPYDGAHVVGFVCGNQASTVFQALEIDAEPP